MPVSFLLLVHRRPRAGRDLDADVPVLPDQGVPHVRPGRRAVLHQYPVPRTEPRQRDLARTRSISPEIFSVDHSAYHRDRAGHRGEIRK